MKNINEYLDATEQFAVYPTDGVAGELGYLALGLAGETGEAVDCVKKMARDPSPENIERQRKKLFLELGDVAWYWVRKCKAAGFKPSEVLAGNIKKLLERREKKELKSR